MLPVQYMYSDGVFLLINNLKKCIVYIGHYTPLFIFKSFKRVSCGAYIGGGVFLQLVIKKIFQLCILITLWQRK